MVVWRKCPICGEYYAGTPNGGRCKCGYEFPVGLRLMKYVPEQVISND